MAKRNRKRQQKDGFMIFRPFGSAIAVLAALALAYVWLGCRCEFVGKEIQKLEQEKTELGKKYRNEEYRWMQMKSPRNVERVLQSRRMEMDWPKSGQVVHLPAATSQAESPERGYLAETKYTGLDRVVR